MKKIISGILIIISTLTILFLIYWMILPYIDKTVPINESSKTCLVTGASYGLGREISKIMVKKGWKVIGIARSEEPMKQLSKELGPNFIYYICDVSKFDCVKSTSDTIKNLQLKPTLFFLNAGIGDLEIPYKFSLKRNQELFNTNYFGTVAWIEQWLNSVKSYGGGTFIGISSISSLFPMNIATYGATKSAINTLFHSLRLQYRNDNIGFTAVILGPIKTRLCRRTAHVHDPAIDAQYIIDKVFERRKQIETNMYFSTLFRIFNWLPDWIALKIKVF